MAAGSAGTARSGTRPAGPGTGNAARPPVVRGAEPVRQVPADRPDSVARRAVPDAPAVARAEPAGPVGPAPGLAEMRAVARNRAAHRCRARPALPARKTTLPPRKTTWPTTLDAANAERSPKPGPRLRRSSHLPRIRRTTSRSTRGRCARPPPAKPSPSHPAREVRRPSVLTPALSAHAGGVGGTVPEAITVNDAHRPPNGSMPRGHDPSRIVRPRTPARGSRGAPPQGLGRLR